MSSNDQLSIELAVSISKAMQAMYGDSFNRKWANVIETKDGLKPENFTSALQFGLAGLTKKQVAHGLHVMRDKPFAPTIPEFKSWCLSGSAGKFLDVEIAYLNAANEKYTDAATYEAARRTGFFEIRSRAESATKPVFKKHYEAVCAALIDNPNAFKMPESKRIEQAPARVVAKNAEFFANLRRGLV